MHVLILTPGFPSLLEAKQADFCGGAFVLTEALAYHSAGARVTVLTPHVPGLPVKETIREGLDVVRFQYFYPSRWQKVRIPKHPLYTTKLLGVRILQLPFFLASFVLSIYRLIDQVDIIHANWTATALLALPCIFSHGVPVVVTYRGSDLTLLPGPLNRFIMRNVSGVLDVWSGLESFERINKSFQAKYIKLPLIARGLQEIDPAVRVSPSGKKETQFLFIGRFGTGPVDLMKGIKQIVPAVNRLRKRYDHFHLHILGDGPLGKDLSEQIKMLGCEQYVTLHGYKDDIFPFLRECDAVVGGLGLNAVAQEAAYSGSLMIMPDDLQYNGRMWIHEENALLYTPGDHESLADAMRYVVEHPEESRRIAVNGRRTIKEYVVGIEEGGRLYLDAFRDIVRNSRQQVSNSGSSV